MDILQPTHLLFVLLVALVVLGPRRLGEASRSVGRTLRSIQDYKEEFKEGLLGMHDEDEPDKKSADEKVVAERKGKG